MLAAVRSAMDRIAFEITDGIIEFNKEDIDYYKNKYPDIYSVLISKWNNDFGVLLSIKQSDDSDGYYVLGYGINNKHQYSSGYYNAWDNDNNYKKVKIKDEDKDNKAKELLFLHSKTVSLAQVHSVEFSSIVESVVVDYYSRVLRITGSMIRRSMYLDSALAEDSAIDLKRAYFDAAKHIVQMNALPRLTKLDRIKLEFKTLADIAYQTLSVVGK